MRPTAFEPTPSRRRIIARQPIWKAALKGFFQALLAIACVAGGFLAAMVMTGAGGK